MGGPDEANNGLLLSTMHHKLFDLGAMSLNQDYHIQVSSDVHGGDRVRQYILDFIGNPIRSPQPRTPKVAQSYIAWHQKEVFKAPGRDTVLVTEAGF